MVTRFTRDLWKLAQENGLTLTNSFIAKMLTAFAMQAYYEDTDNAKNKDKELFTVLDGGGGIRFDMADVAAKFKTAFDAGHFTIPYSRWMAHELGSEIFVRAK